MNKRDAVEEARAILKNVKMEDYVDLASLYLQLGHIIRSVIGQYKYKDTKK
jgi:hypothetical protein